jgi:polysaccharide export outer membrane protein
MIKELRVVFLGMCLLSLTALLSGCGGATNTRFNSAFTGGSSMANTQPLAASVDRAPAPAVRANFPSLSSVSRSLGEPDYRIGTSDLLEVKVFQADELSRAVRVDARGNISLPLLGTVPVRGITSADAEKRIASLLRRNLLQNPQVTVFIKEFTAQRVTIEGEVSKPGVYPIKGQVTVLQSIAMAEGLAEFADLRSVVLFRKQGGVARPYSINLESIRKGLESDPFVVNDDRIVVQRLEQRITVDGEVKRPGVFPFKEKITVLQAVALAQGLSNLAAPEKVVLFRRSEGVERAYAIDLTAIRNGDTPDPFVQHDDRIVVHRSNSRYWLREAATLLSPLNLITNIVR